MAVYGFRKIVFNVLKNNNNNNDGIWKPTRKKFKLYPFTRNYYWFRRQQQQHVVVVEQPKNNSNITSSSSAVVTSIVVWGSDQGGGGRGGGGVKKDENEYVILPDDTNETLIQFLKQEKIVYERIEEQDRNDCTEYYSYIEDAELYCPCRNLPKCRWMDDDGNIYTESDVSNHCTTNELTQKLSGEVFPRQLDQLKAWNTNHTYPYVAGVEQNVRQYGPPVCSIRSFGKRIVTLSWAVGWPNAGEQVVEIHACYLVSLEDILDSICAANLQQLVLKPNWLSPHCLAFRRLVTSLKILVLSGGSLRKKNFIELQTALSSSSSTLEQLILTGIQFVPNETTNESLLSTSFEKSVQVDDDEHPCTSIGSRKDLSHNWQTKICSLRSLTIRNCFIPEGRTSDFLLDGLVSLCGSVPNSLVDFNFMDNGKHCGSKAILTLAMALESKHCQLQHVKWNSSWDDEKENDDSLTCTLRTLPWVRHLDEENSAKLDLSSLGCALGKNHSLKELNLSNNIVESGMNAFVDGLRQNQTLEHLVLRYLSFEPSDFQHFFQSLGTCIPSLRYLDITGSTMTANCVLALAEGLKGPNVQLQHLIACRIKNANTVDPTTTTIDLVGVFEALAINSTLLSLDVSNNKCFDDDGAVVLKLACALKRNTTLKTLHLCHCDISDEWCTIFSSYLPEMRSLQHLSLRMSMKLTSIGAKALLVGVKATTNLLTLQLENGWTSVGGPPSYHVNGYGFESRRIDFYLQFNKFQMQMRDCPLSLWPLIFQNIENTSLRYMLLRSFIVQSL